MAIISTFELLAKRIGPPNGISFPPNANAPFRKLLQGYYLTIANPNNRNVYLRMQSIIPKRKPDSPFSVQQRELVGGNTATRNHVYAYDRTGSSSNPVATPRELLDAMGPAGSTDCSRTFQTKTFQLKKFQTGLVNLLPDPAAASQNNPQLEIRGYTKIVQLKQIKFILIGNKIKLVVITPPPVDLMFTPEIRGTFIDDDFNPFGPAISDLDFDQSNYALPTYTGSAKIRITESVDPRIIYYPRFLNDDVVSELPELIDIEKLTGRLNYMKQFELDDKSLRYIDQSLKKAKIKDQVSMKSVKEQLEASINTLHVKTEKKKA